MSVLIRTAIIALTFLVVARSECDVCQDSNFVACHQENQYSLCINGVATNRYITCPRNYVCTSGPYICYPLPEAKPSCVRDRNLCGVCNHNKVYACANETTIAFCYGEDKPVEGADVSYCLGDTVCDIYSEKGFCTESFLRKPSCVTTTNEEFETTTIAMQSMTMETAIANSTITFSKNSTELTATTKVTTTTAVEISTTNSTTAPLITTTMAGLEATNSSIASSPATIRTETFNTTNALASRFGLDAEELEPKAATINTTTTESNFKVTTKLRATTADMATATTTIQGFTLPPATTETYFTTTTLMKEAAIPITSTGPNSAFASPEEPVDETTSSSTNETSESTSRSKKAEAVDATTAAKKDLTNTITTTDPPIAITPTIETSSVAMQNETISSNTTPESSFTEMIELLAVNNSLQTIETSSLATLNETIPTNIITEATFIATTKSLKTNNTMGILNETTELPNSTKTTNATEDTTIAVALIEQEGTANTTPEPTSINTTADVPFTATTAATTTTIYSPHENATTESTAGMLLTDATNPTTTTEMKTSNTEQKPLILPSDPEVNLSTTMTKQATTTEYTEFPPTTSKPQTTTAKIETATADGMNTTSISIDLITTTTMSSFVAAAIELNSTTTPTEPTTDPVTTSSPPVETTLSQVILSTLKTTSTKASVQPTTELINSIVKTEPQLSESNTTKMAEPTTRSTTAETKPLLAIVPTTANTFADEATKSILTTIDPTGEVANVDLDPTETPTEPTTDPVTIATQAILPEPNTTSTTAPAQPIDTSTELFISTEITEPSTARATITTEKLNMTITADPIIRALKIDPTATTYVESETPTTVAPTAAITESRYETTSELPTNGLMSPVARTKTLTAASNNSLSKHKLPFASRLAELIFGTMMGHTTAFTAIEPATISIKTTTNITSEPIANTTTTKVTTIETNTTILVAESNTTTTTTGVKIAINSRLSSPANHSR